MSYADERARVERLVYECAYLLDRGDEQAVAELFARGTMRVVADGKVLAEATGTDAIAALLSAHADHGGTPGTHHVTTNVSVDVDDSGRSATARSYITLLQATPELPLQAVACGVYHDRFEKDDDGWYFVERRNEPRLVGNLTQRVRRDVPPAAAGLTDFVAQTAP